MLQIIIFSFNRALQLDTLIMSITRRWQSPVYNIDIVYNTSDCEFQKGYDLLIKKYRQNKNIFFYKESPVKDIYSFMEKINIRNFVAYNKNKKHFTPKTNFRSLCNHLLKRDKNEFVMFLTDDAMFIENVCIENTIFDWIKDKPASRQFSLRLGNGMNNQGENVRKEGNYLCWEFHKNARNTNWGYPFSVDAHIYYKESVIKLFTKYIYCNPNTLEGFINAQVYRDMLFEEGRANVKCSLLSYPINMVQTVIKNETLGIDCKMLNDMLLDGYTMKYPIPDAYDTFQQYPTYLYFEKDGVITRKDILSTESL